jgi:Na+/H+ antiporter NhaD/arsenite permease-like protein
MISIFVLLAVFILIAVRQVGKYRLQIWHVMLLGAIAVLLTQQISPIQALHAVNPDVMLFLFGVFIIGQALEESGYLSHLSQCLFGKARTLDRLVFFVILGAGVASAFLMNDTLAIIGTPVMLIIARNNSSAIRGPRLLLLALAFAVTIGSVTSPIGNPQNLLIAIDGQVANPFVTFFKYLMPPTLINLLIAYAVLRVSFRSQFTRSELSFRPEPITDPHLAKLTKISLALFLSLIAVKILFVFLPVQPDLRLTYIALASAVPIVLLSPRRIGIVRRIDWTTLVFFAAMFVLMQSVWDSGFFQSLVYDANIDVAATGTIMGIAIILSQFISNVPLVALYLPLLTHSGSTTASLMALAAGSTIAGNLSILGAASNVIIIQNAERKGRQTITFLEFVRVGVPLTISNAAVYWLYFRLVA